MEENFISYKINRLIEMMYHFEYITEEEYNSYIYGTKDSDKLYLMKLGFRPFLIKKLKEDEQTNNIVLNEYGNLEANEKFKEYLESQNDFYKFHFKKLIYI